MTHFGLHWTHAFASSFSSIVTQVYIELVEMREMGAARSLLRQTSPFEHMAKDQPIRCKHLEDLLTKPYFEAHDVCLKENLYDNPNH